MQTLSQYLHQHATTPAVTAVMLALADGCRAIGQAVRNAAFTGQTGLAGSGNIQGEAQKKLDVLSNDLLAERLRSQPAVCAFASEENDSITLTPNPPHPGGVLVAFDPLDGSSNLDINAPVGTIFSLLPAPAAATVSEADFLQPGQQQLAAGYALYGPATVLVLTVDATVSAFTLDETHGEFILTQDALTLPAETGEFAINAANLRHWGDAIVRYVAECQAGRDGPRSKDFNMRWVAAMVADVHRILSRGGVFLYPADRRASAASGKLRLLYEASPMALLIERAGGLASTGHARILDIRPASLHQRVPVLLGARHEIERLNDYHTS
ncbi:class 1 fructose-bisphosphatase [Chitinilyticum piscinae]|uniref:Fructose-1,6-bisphosphatase class 1 n=1 Tax=Chitinilyticum piscinae TaxID=2866724 RepID=A0A8J7K9V0_9NEIS|nr:class 1 fructose-bisphosphatase [Chitinilyticum piscinae]MBE9608704.1 class 1 fructose-bisphosphatase [Chitinilyticum piscinae]